MGARATAGKGGDGGRGGSQILSRMGTLLWFEEQDWINVVRRTGLDPYDSVVTGPDWFHQKPVQRMIEPSDATAWSSSLEPSMILRCLAVVADSNSSSSSAAFASCSQHFTQGSNLT